MGLALKLTIKLYFFKPEILKNGNGSKTGFLTRILTLIMHRAQESMVYITTLSQITS
jgi:hypothetical protein